MSIRFSPSTSGFYLPGLHADIPSDAIEITDLEHQQLLAGQALGKAIVVGTKGKPVLKQPDPMPVDLYAYSAMKRYELEIGGIVVNGVPIATDRESQALISGAVQYLDKSGATSTMFKAGNSFVELDAATINAVGLAVGAHVQGAFKKEADVASAITGGQITTVKQVDQAYA